MVSERLLGLGTSRLGFDRRGTRKMILTRLGFAEKKHTNRSVGCYLVWWSLPVKIPIIRQPS